MPSFGRSRVSAGKVRGDEFLESVRGDGTFDSVSSDGPNPHIVEDILLVRGRYLWWGSLCGLHSLAHFVHVAEGCFYFRPEVFLYSFDCEAWPSEVIALLDSSDPCCFDGVAGSGVVVRD